MEPLGTTETASPKPWLFILLTAPIPLLLAAFLFSRWFADRTDQHKLTQQFLSRQNTVLAFEAMGVAREVSKLLDRAVSDVKTLALLPPTTSNYEKFYLSHAADTVEYQAGQNNRVLRPLYNELTLYDQAGVARLRLVDGKNERANSSACPPEKLCDSELIDSLKTAPVNDIRLGRLLRWYANKDEPLASSWGTLRVGTRTQTGIVILGIDYRHLYNILYLPTLPYEPKSDLLLSYEAGNYIYLVDADANIIAHPKHFHALGIDRKTGKPVPPVRKDSEMGFRPLNIRAYEGETLRSYFHRLLNVSFVQKNVDIFNASNIQGTIRVLSVAPILFSKGQYQKTGIFGYVITGCNVEYFEEPKEKFPSYY